MHLIFILLYSGCEALVEEINTYQLHPEKRVLLQTPRTTPRNTTPKTLCILGGLSGFDSPDRYLNRADFLCLEDEKKWGQMAFMREARESAGTVRLAIDHKSASHWFRGGALGGKRKGLFNFAKHSISRKKEEKQQYNGILCF